MANPTRKDIAQILNTSLRSLQRKMPRILTPCRLFPGFFTLLHDPLVDLLPVNRNIPGRINTDADLTTLDAQHGHRDFIAHHQRFIDLSR